jgi:hypothetical protein
MLRLKKSLLARGRAATQFHGYGTFFPEPPEIAVVSRNWTELVLS